MMVTKLRSVSGPRTGQGGQEERPHAEQQSREVQRGRGQHSALGSA